jgi:hypothetical protein
MACRSPPYLPFPSALPCEEEDALSLPPLPSFPFPSALSALPCEEEEACVSAASLPHVRRRKPASALHRCLM